MYREELTPQQRQISAARIPGDAMSARRPEGFDTLPSKPASEIATQIVAIVKADRIRAAHRAAWWRGVFHYFVIPTAVGVAGVGVFALAWLIVAANTH